MQSYVNKNDYTPTQYSYSLNELACGGVTPVYRMLRKTNVKSMA